MKCLHRASRFRQLQQQLGNIATAIDQHVILHPLAGVMQPLGDLNAKLRILDR